MKKNLQVISSEPLAVNVPQSWAELSHKQFRFVCSMFAGDVPDFSFDALLFLYLSGIEIVGRNDDGTVLVKHNRTLYQVREADFAIAPDAVTWVHDIAPIGALENVVRAVNKSAVNVRLDSLSLGEFIAADSLYSGYVQTDRQDLAEALVKILFPGVKKVKTWFVTAAIIWFSAAKKYLMDRFPELYHPQDPSDLFSSVKVSPATVRESADSMIRALTKGDITLEERVLNAPLYRALTELNQLAKEYNEIKKLS